MAEKLQEYSLTWEVTDEMTAKRIGSAGSQILSTPNMVALMEAAALNMADNTDAKMETFAEIMEKQKEDQEWSGFQRLLDTRIRKTSI